MAKIQTLPSIADQDIERAKKDYQSTLIELHDLEDEKKKIIADYTYELEQQKIQQISSSV